MRHILLLARLVDFLPVACQVLRRGVLLLAVAGAAGPALAQCPCTYSVGNNDKNTNYTLSAGQTLNIEANVKYTGTITVVGSNATITNNGQIVVAGAVTVNSGLTGTAITNLGQVTSQNIKVNSPATITNGSATTPNTGIVWSGAVGTNFTTAQTINNYASWSAQVDALPSGTVNNYATGAWSAYLVPSGTTVINNSGAWSATDLNYAGSLTINHTAGTWTANLNPGTALAINNSGTWTKGFNFPSAGPNRFTNNAGASATFDTYLGTGSTLTITNSGTMRMSGGMGDLSSNSLLDNNRGATFQVTGQFVNAGTVSNAGTISTTGNFTNSSGGVITGPAAPLRGSITAGGYTQNAGMFGAIGRLDFCATMNHPAAGFDSQTGTVGSSTTFCSARPLPVELVSFTAAPVKNFVRLRWATASEQGSARFVVERSAQGAIFEAVCEVAAQGTAAQPTAYAAEDARPLAGRSYYRLRQVDLDGRVAFSPVLAVRMDNPPLGAYPNPVADRLVVDLTLAPAEACTVRVLSLTGQVLLAETLAGGRVQELLLTGLSAGFYVLHLRTARGTTVQRIQKQ